MIAGGPKLTARRSFLSFLRRGFIPDFGAAGLCLVARSAALLRHPPTISPKRSRQDSIRKHVRITHRQPSSPGRGSCKPPSGLAVRSVKACAHVASPCVGASCPRPVRPGGAFRLASRASAEVHYGILVSKGLARARRAAEEGFGLNATCWLIAIWIGIIANYSLIRDGLNASEAKATPVCFRAVH
jgi:hypothetical protein